MPLPRYSRGNWNNDSDWLSLITFNKVTRSNRDMAHHDQVLSFEYYSRGDLLLADGGEEKYVLDKTYGMYDISHNTVAIENPRTPFPVSPLTGSSSLGIFKGYNVNLVTPPTVDTIVQAPWIQALQTHVSITKLSPGNGITYTPQNLSSPIHTRGQSSTRSPIISSSLTVWKEQRHGPIATFSGPPA